MHDDPKVFHLQQKFERLQDKLARKEVTEKSFAEGRSKIRKEAKDNGIEPNLVAPTGKRAVPTINMAQLDRELARKFAADSRALITAGHAVIELPVDQVRVDATIQQRTGHLDLPVLASYVEAMARGDIFPPVVVFRDLDGIYWLADGFHRLGAIQARAEKAEWFRTFVNAEVREGDRRDALLYAVGANADHGLRRTNDDKRKAVETLLLDQEWSTWSDNVIAEKARVSHTFVGKVRAEMESTNSTCNVASGIDDPEPVAGEYIPAGKPKPAAVRTCRNGKTMRIEKIGKKAETPPKPKPEAKPAKPKITEAQVEQAVHRLSGALSDLRSYDAHLGRSQAGHICRLAADTIEHYIDRLDAPEKQALLARFQAQQEGASDA